MSNIAPDRRELILARLEVVLAACAPAEHFGRNVTEIPESKRPGIIMLDADENPAAASGTVPSPQARGGGITRSAQAPVLMVMTPEVYLFVDGKQPPGAPKVNPGTRLNTLRSVVIGRVMNDSALLALCTDSAITYEGFASGFAAGRTIEGEGGVGFTFYYTLFPNRLAP